MGREGMRAQYANAFVMRFDGRARAESSSNSSLPGPSLRWRSSEADNFHMSLDLRGRIEPWVGPTFIAVLAVVFGALALGRYVDVGPFRPQPWVDRQGRVASLQHFQSSTVPYEHPGASACGWNATTFIDYAGGSYVREPSAAMAAAAGREGASLDYEPDARVPADAEPTGWRKGDSQLWVSASETSRGRYLAVYVVSPTQVERWPLFPVTCP